MGNDILTFDVRYLIFEKTMRHNFKELKIWQLGMEIARLIYKITKQFPREEQYGLTSQMQRAAVSIPSNIAEGCGRGTDLQTIHFLDIALGSSCELETQLLLSLDFDYYPKSNYEEIALLIDEFQRKTRNFRDKIASKSL